MDCPIPCSHQCTTKNIDGARINIELQNTFSKPKSMHQSVKNISEQRYSRFNNNRGSITSNVIVTEPRRDGSYNSLLDIKETERRTSNRGIGHVSSIKPYTK